MQDIITKTADSLAPGQGPQIETLWTAPTARVCAARMLAFAEEVRILTDEKQKQVLLDRFWASMTDASALDRNIGAPGNSGWLVCPPEKSVATFYDIQLIRGKTPEEDIEAITRCAQEALDNLTVPDGSPASPESARQVLEYLDQAYDLTQRVFSQCRSVFILLPDGNKYGVCLPMFRFSMKNRSVAAHLAVFGNTANSSLVDLLISPAYSIIRGAASAMAVAALLHPSPEPSSWRLFLPGEITRAIKALHPDGGIDHSPIGVVETVAEDITNSLVADCPYTGLLVNPKESTAVQQYRRYLLDLVLAAIPVPAPS